MNDIDRLANRLEELGRTAPAPAVDPLGDTRRGRKALRRRRARAGAGVGAAIVAAVIAVTTLDVPGGQGDPDGGSSGGTASPGVEVASDSISGLCLQSHDRRPELNGQSGSRSQAPYPADEPPTLSWEHPSVAPALAAYRQAAAAILDPAGTHIDLSGDSTNIQYGCDAQAVRLTSLGTTFAWNSSGAVGMVKVEVVSPEHGQPPQVVILQESYGRAWTAVDRNVPIGVTQAKVIEYPGGRAVSVVRQDGLTVAVQTGGTWGNNVAPGSSPAGDLATVDQLLELAASDALVLPED